MFKKSRVSSAVLVVLGGSFVLGAQPALAQSTERVEITGTRIRTPGVISNSPISSLSADELNVTQPTAVEEVVRTLPAAVPAIGQNTNNGSGGGATIDLRGLGTNRSLVLVNGRRMVPFNLDGAVDTNSIPIALLERIDVVTGGASAVYGADAVAGVVNFVLKKNFKGFELGATTGVSGEGDAKRWRTDATFGASLDNGRGNVALSIGKTSTDQLNQDQREIGLAALSSTTGARSGSGTDVPSQFTISGLGTRQIDPATGLLVAPGAGFNFNPANLFVTPLDRQQFTALGNYVINERAEVYGELFHTRSDVRQELASSGTFNNVFQVPIGNPYMPQGMRSQVCAALLGVELAKPAASQNAALIAAMQPAACVAGNSFLVPLTIGRRLVELGPRLGNFENKTSQFTLGVKGSITDTWSYDAYFARGEADQVRTLGNWGSLSKVRQALNAVSTTSCVDSSNGCVPLNVWGAAGSVTPAMINFMNLSSTQLQSVEQEVMAATVTGDLGKARSPWAKSPINVAIGLERREMTAGNKSDASSQIQGEVLGTGAPLPDRSGTVTFKEGFVEMLAPIVEGMPGAHSLVLEAGFRASEFKTTSSQNYNTHKIGGEWSPIKGLRIRGMAQRATRAPGINELFRPQTSGLSNLAVDPCQLALVNQAQANTAGTLSNLCRLTGVPVSQIGSLSPPSAGQINQLSGGNPDLGPEIADTETIGFVFEPAAVPGLLVSLDYYKIDLAKTISNASTTDILTQCYGATANPTFAFNASCALIFRDPTNGSFNGVGAKGVFTALSNLGTLNTAGYDIAVHYRLPLKNVGLNPKWGQVDLSLAYNQVDKLMFQATPASINRNCNGFYSVACGNAFGSPNFKYKFTQRGAWTMGNFALSYSWRRLSSAIEEPIDASFLPQYSRIKAYDYVDVGGSWTVNKNLKLTLSIANLFDKAPPNVGSTIGTTSTNHGNTFPATYDTVGRYFTLGATAKF